MVSKPPKPAKRTLPFKSRMSPDDRARRQRIKSALERAESDYRPIEIKEATGITNQAYTQFKRTLSLGKAWLSSLEKFLVGKGYLPKPAGPEAPYPTAKPPALVEIKEMLGTLRSIVEDAERDGCSAAQLGFLQTGATRLRENLIPRLVAELEGGTHDTSASSSPQK